MLTVLIIVIIIICPTDGLAGLYFPQLLKNPDKPSPLPPPSLFKSMSFQISQISLTPPFPLSHGPATATERTGTSLLLALLPTQPPRDLPKEQIRSCPSPCSNPPVAPQCAQDKSKIPPQACMALALIPADLSHLSWLSSIPGACSHSTF